MVKRLTKAYAKQYKELRLLALQTDPDSYFSSYEEAKKLPDYSYESELNAQKDPLGYYGSFSDTGVLLGYVSIQLPYFAKQSHVLELFNLYVHPEYRKQKIGSKLVSHIIEVSKVRPVSEVIFLSVMGENEPALSLYRSLGFSEYGRKARSLKMNDRYVDEVLMRLDL